MLGCLYTELPRPSGGDRVVGVTSLLKKFLGILADNLNASAFQHVLHDECASHAAVQVLISFHSFILILQGKSSLGSCSHPSAEPVDLQFPSELRPSIRKVVGGIEEGLTVLATGVNPFANDVTNSQASRSSLSQLPSAPGSGSSTSFPGSSSSEWGTTSGSQIRSTPPPRGEVVTRDAFDGG